VAQLLLLVKVTMAVLTDHLAVLLILQAAAGERVQLVLMQLQLLAVLVEMVQLLIHHGD
jgi:hypothetical protein